MIQFATICCVIQHTDHNSNNIVCNNSLKLEQTLTASTCILLFHNVAIQSTLS